jgi:hypothetical protein
MGVSEIKGRTKIEVFENRSVRRIFGPKRDEMTGGGENCIIRSSIFCILQEMLQ